MSPSTPAPQGEKCAHAPEDESSCTNCPTVMDLGGGEREPYRHPETNAVLCNSCYIEHMESALARERESRKQAFNAGWNAAIEEIAEKAPYMRLFRLRESIRLNLRPPPEPRKVVTRDDIDRIDAEEGPNRAVVKGRSERFGDSHD
jgi:hypothetical protein